MTLAASTAAAALAWFGELGGKRVKSEIGRVKSWRSFPVSLFAIHSCPSAELSVVVLESAGGAGNYSALSNCSNRTKTTP
jgi:hypothetical protein